MKILLFPLHVYVGISMLYSHISSPISKQPGRMSVALFLVVLVIFSEISAKSALKIVELVKYAAVFSFQSLSSAIDIQDVKRVFPSSTEIRNVAYKPIYESV